MGLSIIVYVYYKEPEGTALLIYASFYILSYILDSNPSNPKS